MRINQCSAWRNGMARLIGLAILTATFPAFGQVTFLVDSLADDPLQDSAANLCVTAGDECTFRAALQAANNRSDTITIDMSPDIPVDALGRSIISPSSPLPSISSQVIVRGETHPNFLEAEQLPRFLIDGSNADDGTDTDGLTFDDGSQHSEVRFVAIYSFTRFGLLLIRTSAVTLLGNHVGLRPLFQNTSEVAGNGSRGVLVFDSSDNLVEDNWISGNETNHGIGIGNGSADNILVGNRIGQRPVSGGTGVAVAGNGGGGISISGDAGSGNQVGRCVIVSTLPIVEDCRGNVIAGNGGNGIRLASNGQFVRANRIGIVPEDPSNAAFGNTGHGILVQSSGNVIGGGLNIGLTGNVIGHNGTTPNHSGIHIASGASNNQTLGARIGVDHHGNNVGNTGVGITIASGFNNSIRNSHIENNNRGVVILPPDGNEVTENEIIANGFFGIEIVDATATIENNIIGSHTVAGILVEHPDSAAVATIRQNHIGVRPDGSNISNHRGILVSNGHANIGDSEGRGNIIGFNAFSGIEIDRSNDVQILGNRIGVLPDGTPAGNGNGGVIITSSQDDGEASSNTVGFQATVPIPAGYDPDDGGPGNIIAHNGIAGVLIFSERDNTTLVNNSIRGNRFYANSGQAIDLGPEGDTVDPGGGDSGPNELQNFPVFNNELTHYDEVDDRLYYAFSVNTSTVDAAYPLRVDLYLADGSSSQGHYFIDTVAYESTDAMTQVSDFLTPPAGLKIHGARLVATATDSDGNTSQFSASVQLQELQDEIFHDAFKNAARSYVPDG